MNEISEYAGKKKIVLHTLICTNPKYQNDEDSIAYYQDIGVRVFSNTGEVGIDYTPLAYKYLEENNFKKLPKLIDHSCEWYISPSREVKVCVEILTGWQW